MKCAELRDIQPLRPKNHPVSYSYGREFRDLEKEKGYVFLFTFIPNSVTKSYLANMSFLTELRNRKQKLKETQTVVTSVDGKQYLETKQDVKPLNKSVYGFVVDTKPDDIPVLITDYVYIGSQDCAVNSVLEKYNIKHVLSLGINVEVNVDCKFINILDVPETDITIVLKDSLTFIRDSIVNKENVLVHCNAGVSRTSTIAIAYLMQYELLTFEDAYNLVKMKRPAIKPNDGFKKQLIAMTPGQCI